MDKTLNQRIYETPADIKKAIYDRGYEAGKQAGVEEFFQDIVNFGACSQGITLNAWEIAELKEKYNIK